MNAFVWAPAGPYGATASSLSAGPRALRTRVGPAPAARRRRSQAAWLSARRTRQCLTIASDILMVTLWAAMVPGLMWLGAAAGF